MGKKNRTSYKNMSQIYEDFKAKIDAKIDAKFKANQAEVREGHRMELILTALFFAAAIYLFVTEVRSLGSKFDSLKSDVGTLKSDFSSLNSKMEHMNQTLTSKFDSLDKRLSTKIDNLDQRLTWPNLSQDLACKCAVSIEISPGSREGNTMACGSLVQLRNGQQYILTNKHVVFDETEECFTTVKRVRTTKNVSIPVRYRETHMAANLGMDLDLAIIPVEEDEMPAGLIPCNVTTNSARPTFHEEVYGVSQREHSTRALYGRVLEVKQDGNNFLADFQGANGFSGTGYFSNGELVAVHVGAESFRHFDGLDKKEFRKMDVLQNNWKESYLQGLRAASRGTVRQVHADNSFVALNKFVEIVARNPQAHGVRAHSAHDLPLDGVVAHTFCEGNEDNDVCQVEDAIWQV